MDGFGMMMRDGGVALLRRKVMVLDKAKIIYTAGYGNDVPEKFLGRLKAAGVTVVLDVRREGSKSWCNSYHYGKAMERFLGEIKYGLWPSLANHFDVLEAYKEWLESPPTESTSARGFLTEMQYLMNRDDIFCFICAERDAIKDGVVNCHRVYVADALVNLLGNEWSVIHI